MRLGDKNIAAVGFDLDFTLYDQSQHALTFFRAAAEKVGRETGRGTQAAYLAFITVWENKTPRFGRLFDDVLETLGRSSSDIVERLVREQRAWRPPLELYPGVRTALERLGNRFPLFLVTDGHASTQRYKVEALGLAPLFDVLVYTDEFGGAWQKPNETAFRYAADRLGVPPEECCYAGDNPLVDGEGAQRSGMGHVRVLQGPYRHVRSRAIPDKEVRCASEIAELFGV